MKLLTIIICLVLERYLNLGANLPRYPWFDAYLNLLRDWLKPEFFWRGWISVVTIMLPVLLIVGLVCLITHHWMFGIVWLVLDVVILLYCLGPDDLYHQMQAYTEAGSDDDSKKATTVTQAAILGEQPPKGEAKAYRAITIAIVTKANERLFAVIFWFICLGPVGAVMYRLAVLLHNHTHGRAAGWQATRNAAYIFQQILDWIPARLTALLYTLVGHFNASFGTWLKYVASGLNNNEVLLSECGLHTLSIMDEDSGKASLKENQQAMALVDRTLIVSLVIIAISTVGAWIS